MKKELPVWLCILFALNMTGCSFPQRGTPAPIRTVSEIQIEYTAQSETIQKIYQQPRKMVSFLNALRLIEQNHGPRNLPVDLLGARWQITLQFSDGTQKRYRIQSDRYLCSDSHGWKSIQENRTQKLYGLLRDMPSDQLSQNGSLHSPHFPTRDLNCSS